MDEKCGSHSCSNAAVNVQSHRLSHTSSWTVNSNIINSRRLLLDCRNYMAEYVERLPVETEQKAHKLLRVCERNGLHSQCKYCTQSCLRASWSHCLFTYLLWLIYSTFCFESPTIIIVILLLFSPQMIYKISQISIGLCGVNIFKTQGSQTTWPTLLKLCMYILWVTTSMKRNFKFWPLRHAGPQRT